MPRRNLLWLLFLAAASLACYDRVQHNPNGRAVGDVLDQISRHYYEPVDSNSLFQGAVEGMVERLKDDYSAYIAPAEQKEFDAAINKRFEGVGMEVALDPKTKQLTVVTPFAGSPAYEAGVRAGDTILKIDGRATQGMSPEEAVKLIQGAPGTSVALLLLHEGQQKPVGVDVVRRMIEVDTVRGDRRNADGSWDFFLPGHDRLGYIRVTGFAEKTADDLRQAMEWLTEHQMRALILDLRDNPGGLLASAAEVCDMFIDQGVIVVTKGREGQIREELIASGKGRFTDFPMAVLVNQNSASASEIVAACLQDHQRATIVGQRTFGKGTVQEVSDLGDDRGELKLTVASYWRPSNKNIHRPHGAGENDVWGVQPSEGYAVVVEGDELKRLYADRLERDIFRPGQQPRPPDAARPSAPVVDRQLAKAIACVDGKGKGQ